MLYYEKGDNMDKIELLSPAGNKESLYMAVHAGATAVYISGKRFGARAFATNFDENEIVDAIKYCHLYGVKVYVTMNTLVFESEIDDFIEYAKFLYINNVDAIIVQDIGMISYLRKYIPDLEIHSSTQTHNYNIETTKMFKNLGVKRVVLARELTIDEIKQHSKIMDTECFVHGALCMSYSGCCYMSLDRGNRSGNRGECAGTCRLKFDVDQNDKYILSTKDLCNVYDIDKIIESGTKSIKIEGRMKSKEYVYLVTKLYRETIDKYYETNKVIVNENTYNDIKRVFNRDYTRGHKFESTNIMNQKRPNNKGIPLGQVVKFDKNYITIKLSSNLINGDGIKFESTDTGLIVTNMYLNNKKINSALKGQTISIKNEINLNKLSNVVKTLDKELIDSLKNIKEKKIKINCEVNITKTNINIKYSDGINIVEKNSKEVEIAKNTPISKEEVENRLSKLGSTPFIIDNINVNIEDNLFIKIKTLNEIRRELIDELINLRQNKTKILQTKEVEENINLIKKDKIELSVSVVNEEQYKEAKKNNVDNIYTSNIELNKKYKDTYLILPRIIKDKKYDSDNIVVNDYNYLNAKNIVGNYYLNLTNSKSIIYALKKRITKICVAPDLKEDNIKDILKTIPNIDFEIQVYGRKELMIKKNYFGNFKNIKSGKYEYKVIDNKSYTSILSETKNNINNIKEYLNIGIKSFRVDLSDENSKEVNKILSEIKKQF